MTVLSYVIGAYEQKFPSSLEPTRSPSWFWRVVHALAALGFIYVCTEGDFYRNGRWTWTPWRPQVYRVGGRYTEFCPTPGERLTRAWLALRARY